MRWFRTAAALMLLATPALVAQTDEPKKPEAGAPTAAPTRADRIAAVKKDFQKAQSDFSKGYQKLKTDAERSEYYEKSYPNADTYAERMLAIVEEDPKDDASRGGLTWVLSSAKGKMQNRALALLAEHHALSEGIAESCASIGGMSSPEAEKFLKKVIAENKNEKARATATYCLATNLKNAAEMHDQATGPEHDAESEKGMKRYLGEEGYARIIALDPAKARAESEKLLETCVNDFKEVAYRKSTIGKIAAQDLFEARNLAIGKVAPEVAGADLEGVDFKLSDYRGKVVVLDFWGYW